VFRRLARESGAESFFPSSERGLKKALDRISALLETQYTLAYYPRRVDKIRKIEVKVDRSGVNVAARRSVGSESPSDTVHFAATSCSVSPKDHPYPWESRVTSTSSDARVYHEDFSDPQSGWPNGRFFSNTGSMARYVRGGYEVYRARVDASSLGAVDGVIATAADTVIAAYGPWWENFRASALVEQTNNGGLVFDVMEQGYYAFLLQPVGKGNEIDFSLVKGYWNGTRSTMLPWTPVMSVERPGKVHKLSVECERGYITLQVDDRRVGIVRDTTFRYGLVGFGVLGEGHVGVHDLRVEAVR
jgi:hypothetical protein